MNFYGTAPMALSPGDKLGPPPCAAFLGSQGDIWDAQKDMLADTLSAVAATALFFARSYRSISLLPMDSSVMENVRSSPARG